MLVGGDRGTLASSGGDMKWVSTVVLQPGARECHRLQKWKGSGAPQGPLGGAGPVVLTSELGPSHCLRTNLPPVCGALSQQPQETETPCLWLASSIRRSSPSPTAVLESRSPPSPAVDLVTAGPHRLELKCQLPSDVGLRIPAGEAARTPPTSPRSRVSLIVSATNSCPGLNVERT